LRNAVRIKKYLNNAGDGFDRKIRRLDVSLLGQVLVHIGKAVVSDRDARDIAVPPQGFVLFLCQHSVCLLSPSFYHPARERTSHQPLRKENNMTGKIIITGISDAEKAAKEILEHIQAIKDIQRRMVWFGSDIQIVLDSKEEAASGN